VVNTSSVLVSITEVAVHRVRLLLGWVTVCWQVKHLGRPVPNHLDKQATGPYVTVYNQVVERANNVKYGLCATVWSSDVNKAHRVARKLQVSA